MFVQGLFWFFAAILVIAALASSRRAIRALGVVAGGVLHHERGHLAALEAEFLAVVLVLVYVGAVMVLFLFVVMMLDINTESLRSGFTKYAWLGWIRRRGHRRDRWRRHGRSMGVDITRAWRRSRKGMATHRARFGAVHEIRLSVRARRRAAARRHRGRHRAHDAQAAEPQGSDIVAQTKVRARDRVRIIKMDAGERRRRRGPARGCTPANTEKGA